jgi:hypothetical protein
VRACYGTLEKWEPLEGAQGGPMPDFPLTLFWSANQATRDGGRAADVGHRQAYLLDIMRSIGSQGNVFGVPWADGNARWQQGPGTYDATFKIASKAPGAPIPTAEIFVRFAYTGGNDLTAQVTGVSIT